MNTRRATKTVSLTLLVVFGSVTLFPVASVASESGKKNTAIALGVATILLATKKNKTPALAGALATAYAYSQYNKEKKDRQENEDWRYRRSDRNNDYRNNDTYRYDRGYQNSQNRNTYYSNTRYINTALDKDYRSRDIKCNQNDKRYDSSYRSHQDYGNYQGRYRDSRGNWVSNSSKSKAPECKDKDIKWNNRDNRNHKQIVRLDNGFHTVDSRY